MCLFPLRVSRHKENISKEKILADENSGDDERDKLLHLSFSLTHTHKHKVPEFPSSLSHTLPSIPVPVGILRHALFQKSISAS